MVTLVYRYGPSRQTDRSRGRPTDRLTDRHPHLQEDGHLRLVHGVDAGLQDPGHAVQVFCVLPLQGADVVQLLLLLRRDLHAHLALALLQDGVEVVEGLAHLGLLSASVLLSVPR